MKKPAAPAEELFTIPEVAELWRVERTTVYRHIWAGELRTTNVGTTGRPKLRVPASALAEFVKRHAA